MKKNILFILAATALLCGCAKETLEVSSKMVPVTISTSMTKTSLDGLNVLWTAGDQITVIADDGNAYTFTLTEGAGAATGTFVGSLPETVAPQYAIYPKNEAAAKATLGNYFINKSTNDAVSNVDGVLGLEYPAVQAAISGSAEVIPTFGAVSGSAGNYSVTMKNTGLLFKITVPSTLTDIVSITLSSVNGTPLSGPFGVEVTAANIDNVYTVAKNWDTQVTLSNGGNVITPATYYLSAMYYASGVTSDKGVGNGRCSLSTMMLKLEKSDGKVAYVKLTGGPAKGERGKIYPIDLTGKAISWGTAETVVFDFSEDLPSDFPTSLATRTTEDKTITKGGHTFVLYSYTTTDGYNGWGYSSSSDALTTYYYKGTSSSSKDKLSGKSYIKFPDDYDGKKLMEVFYSTTSQNKGITVADSLMGSNMRHISTAYARNAKPVDSKKGIIRHFIDQEKAVGTNPDYNYGYFLNLSHSGSFVLVEKITCIYTKPED